MAYRKYLKLDPFEAARRGLEGKLTRIQAQILNKFPLGEPRELMRRTIKQLLQGETTTEGRIKQLIAIVDHYDSEYASATNYTDAHKRSEHSIVMGNMARNSFDDVTAQEIRRSNAYSPIAAPSQKIKRSLQENYRYYTENQEEDSRNAEISQAPSHNTPFSKLASMKNSSYSDLNSHSQSHSFKKNDSSAVMYDSINEKDIFSFRTQKQDQSPTINKSKMVKVETPKSNARRGSRSKHSSKEYSEKSSKSLSKKLSSKSKSRMKVNYDGKSQLYTPNKSHSSFKGGNRSLKKEKALNSSLSSSKLVYQKIMNRLKYSSCVIGKIDHSNRYADSFLLQNRFKLQSEGRRSLIQQMERCRQESSVWK